MIRVNAFFKVKAGVTTAQVKALTDELVESSRKDEGNKGYDLFESTTQPGVYMFCESWENAELLKRHAASEHFTRIVPELEKLTDGGLSIEQFKR